MAKRGRKTLTEIDLEKPIERASPESEARFPQHLSPIIQCKKSVLDRSRIEFYAAIILGAVQGILPMNAATRSLVLLLVFGPLIDLVWRSPWSHSKKRVVKVSATSVLVAIYFGIVGLLFIREHEAAALALQQYLRSGRGEWLIRWAYAVAASLATYVVIKVSRLIRAYIRESHAEELAIQKKFYDATPKGWLDYRLESEKSSARLHFLVGRMTGRVKAMAIVMRLVPWIVHKSDKRPATTRAQIALFFLTFACEIYSRKIEPEVKDMETTAETFMKSTEGYLKTASLISKDDFVHLSGVHEYFQWQLKDVREITNVLAPFSSTFNEVRGNSKESTAAINRFASVMKAQSATLRRVEGHCARMVKLSEDKFDRAILKVTKPLLTSLGQIMKLMKGEEGVKEYQRLLSQHGINPASIKIT